MRRGVGAVERGTAEKELHPYPVDDLRQTRPCKAQDVGVVPVRMQAEPPEFEEGTGQRSKPRQVVETGRIASADPCGIGNQQRAKGGDRLARGAVAHRPVLAGGVERVFVAAPATEAKRTQGKRLRAVLFDPVSAEGQGGGHDLLPLLSLGGMAWRG